MIHTIQIQGFKRFANEEFGMAPLTVLAGMNGAGKTSVIHALILIKEATRRSDQFVELNGPYGLDLGTFADIQNWNAPELVRFKLTDQQGVEYAWEFQGSDTGLYAGVKAARQDVPAAFERRGRMFQYLSAERIGPRSILGSLAIPAELLEVGSRGEYSAQLLYALDTFPVDTARRCPGATENDAALLKFETERWLSRVARPVQIDTETLAGTAVTALRFRGPNEEWVRPPNMGFGVTYALPVILAGLTAGMDGLLIVENPEAHLHPAGQSQMGHFLAAMAAAGVQVLVETHSDHVLNGIRRAIGEPGGLPASKAKVHFFDGDHSSSPQTLSFTETGGIDSWPRGFFDQFQLDVAALTRLRRPH
jgi:predicted ATPase